MREWLHNRLLTGPTTVAAMTPTLLSGETMADRVFGKNSLRTAQQAKPFIVHGLGVVSAEGLHDEEEASRQFFQVWIHDRPYDYELVDQLVAAVIADLKGQQSPPDRVLTVLWLETSQEFDDQTLDTVFRYVRFQAVRSAPA